MCDGETKVLTDQEIVELIRQEFIEHRMVNQ